VSGRRRLIIVLALFLAGLAIAVGLERIGPWRSPARKPDDEGSRPIPQRIIATAPSMVECLFALGAGQQVVGVGDFATYPPEARAKPRVGGEMNPNFERILSLQPDLVVVQGKAESLDAFCQRYGIALLRIEPDDIATTTAGMHTLGRAVGREAEADRLVARIRLDLAAVALRVAGRPRPKVFLCLGRQIGSLRSLFSTGRGTFLAELLAVAGGENVLADIEQPYPQVSKESLVRRAPDVVIELHPGRVLSEADRQGVLADWKALGTLPAAAQGRVHVLTDDFLLIPGPRMARVAERLASVLHPLAEPTRGR